LSAQRGDLAITRALLYRGRRQTFRERKTATTVYVPQAPAPSNAAIEGNYHPMFYAMGCCTARIPRLESYIDAPIRLSFLSAVSCVGPSCATSSRPGADVNHVGGGLSPLSQSAAVGDIKFCLGAASLPGLMEHHHRANGPNWKKPRNLPTRSTTLYFTVSKGP